LNLAWQILGFLGMDTKIALSAQRSQKLSASIGSTSQAVRDESGWQVTKVARVAKKISWEISNTLRASSLYKWVNANKSDLSKMAYLFSFSAWYSSRPFGFAQGLLGLWSTAHSQGGTHVWVASGWALERKCFGAGSLHSSLTMPSSGRTQKA
jgi:hypothetical protein